MSLYLDPLDGSLDSALPETMALFPCVYVAAMGTEVACDSRTRPCLLLSKHFDTRSNALPTETVTRRIHAPLKFSKPFVTKWKRCCIEARQRQNINRKNSGAFLKADVMKKQKPGVTCYADTPCLRWLLLLKTPFPL